MYEAEAEWADLKKEDPRALAESIDQAVRAIETSPAEKARMNASLVDLALYCGQPFTLATMSDLWWSYKAIADAQTLKYNAAYSVISTIVSRICSFRPRAQFIPEAGNYKTQRLCRDRTYACDAWSQREQYQEQASYGFRDCLTGPGGVLKVYLETPYAGTNDEETLTRMGRFPSWEIKVNDSDGRYGEPEFMYHVKYITQRQALKLYGVNDNARALIVTGAERLSAMEGYSADTEGNGLTWRNGVRLVRVVDAYAKGPKGRHIITAGDYVAYDTEWKHRWHPFEVMRFDRAEGTGYWGRSALEKVRGIQTGLDASTQDIDDAHHLAAKLIVVGPESPERWTNDIQQYYKATPGQGWTFHNPKATDPDAYRWFEMKKAWMFEVLGVSPNAAQATKPQGVTAAVAIDAVTDLQSDRLSQLSQMWEQLIVRVAERWFALEGDATGDWIDVPGEGRKVQYSDRTYIATDRGRARKADVHPDGSTPVIRTFPTSLFGQSVPARLQKAMDAVKAGWFDQEEIMKVLGVPDLEAVFEIKLAEYEWTENFCDQLLEDGKYETPTVWANPIKLFEYARLRFLRADTDGSYPVENMAKMRKLLDYLQPIAQAARDKAAGKAPALPVSAAPGAPALPAGPPAPGAISPVSAPPAPVAAPPLPGLTPSPEASPGPV